MPVSTRAKDRQGEQAGEKRKREGAAKADEKVEAIDPPADVKEASDGEAEGDTLKQEEPPHPGDPTPETSNTDKEKEEGEEEDQPPAKSAKTTSPLDWLLSDEAFTMANPAIPQGHGEVDWDASEGHQKTPPAESAGKSAQAKGNSGGDALRYPHSHLTPFQNLVAACLLSKPISHKLGLRTISTLLNPPFELRTLSDLDEAGYEGRRKVMWEARTQHKEKTAAQLGDVCDGVRELCGDVNEEEDLSEMKAIRARVEGMGTGEAAEEVVKTLTQIKGIGPGVASIFLRRVQGDWDEVFPYADDKSLEAAREFGLIEAGQGADALAKKVGGDRAKFVRLLDTLIGLTLEKVTEEAKRAAGM